MGPNSSSPPSPVWYWSAAMSDRKSWARSSRLYLASRKSWAKARASASVTVWPAGSFDAVTNQIPVASGRSSRSMVTSPLRAPVHTETPTRSSQSETTTVSGPGSSGPPIG
jgi:hypothetical protein